MRVAREQGSPARLGRDMAEKKSDLKTDIINIIRFTPDRNSFLLMLFSVALNIGGHFLANLLHLPFWLDMAGTMMVSCLLGPLAGSVVALVTSGALFFIHGVNFIFVLSAISTAVIVGFLYPRKNKNDHFLIVSCAAVAGAVSTFICTPINLHLFDGYCGNIWGNALYDMLRVYISSATTDSFLSQAFIDLPDRLVSIYIAYGLILLGHFFFSGNNKNAKKSGKKAGAAGIIVILLAPVFAAFFAGSEVQAKDIDLSSEYETITYGSHEGILVSEINAVAQTDDGYIWAGTYSGLYRYDGMKFEEADIDDRIRNVTRLFPDSKGRLWIGTNDSGIACYDYRKGTVDFYSTENGLPADSIRAIGEDHFGNIYVGTVQQLAKISPGGKMKVYTAWEDVYYVSSLDTLDNGGIVGVTNGGVMFLIQNDMLMYTAKYGRDDGTEYRFAESAGDSLLVGTTTGIVDRYRVEETSLRLRDHLTIGGSFCNSLNYVKELNGFFYCCENGFGFYNLETGKTLDMARIDFEGAVSDVCYDHQGNVWFGSSKHGILKYSRSPFNTLFHKTGSEPDVVNALLSDGDLLYIGMDRGLKIVDMKKGEEVTKEFQSKLEGVRIRNIFKDSENNLWFSTYGENGLIRIDESGKTKNYNEKSEGTLGNKFRSVIELSTGEILAASNMGLSYIENGKVVETIGEKNGLNNQYILTMTERPDGTILAGSDGDGIYIIKDRRIIGHIGKDEGLLTAVVLRIVPCDSGYIYVTSNALYYDDGTEIRELKNFPYPNNYDVIFAGDNMAWITSSAGLYLVNKEDLLSDGEYSSTLLNDKWGLTGTLNANSWNIVKDDVIYLCCTDGVRSISSDDYSLLSIDYKLHLKSVDANGEKVLPNEDGEYILPPTEGRIRFNIAVTNYSLSNPLLQYYLEGSDDTGITCYQSDVVPLEFTNLPQGKYRLHVRVLDAVTMDVKNEEIFEITELPLMYEKLFFRIYMMVVMAASFFYGGWALWYAVQKARNYYGLQKEISTDAMTGLLNKGAVHKQFPEVCKNEKGILIMIDLDSFKLVNDLYGHDMGDKILIRFAELINEGVKEGDLTGRLGGDEFIAFLKNTAEEEDVENLCTHLNKGIVRSAKDFMGEDMNIPLGASLGAVRIPKDGDEFDNLFRLADKALYLVKQNGKHGYAFYQKGKDRAGDDADGSGNNDLAQIKKIIGERNEGKGAYFVNFDRLQVIYKYLCRNDRINSTMSGFARISFNAPEGAEISDEMKEALEDLIVTSLRKNDVVSLYAGSFYVLSVGGSQETYRERIEEIVKKWEEDESHKDIKLEYELETVG